MKNLFKDIRWIYPGLKLKRWIVTICIGVLFIFLGASSFTVYLLSVEPANVFFKTSGPIFLFVGLIVMFIGIHGIITSIIETISGYSSQLALNKTIKKFYLREGPRVVAFGGGTGMSQLLKGLKEYTSNITAIVSVADNGGHSGVLRRDLEILPPGDIRNCMVALADFSSIMGQLMQYRFTTPEMDGYNFGNLFLAAMTKITGDFSTAVQKTSEILSIRGKVIPSTSQMVTLVACYEDGTRSTGEVEVGKANKKIEKLILQPKPKPVSEEIKKAIQEAEIITFGPGSLYTSILPNLIIDGMMESIIDSPATKVYICNVMTQYGETTNFSASEHLKALYDITGYTGWIDYIVVNTKPFSREILELYKNEKSFPVEVDYGNLKKLNVKILEGDFVYEANYARHNPEKLAKTLMELYTE